MSSSAGRADDPASPVSTGRFLIRVALSLTVPIVLIGAVLWWFVVRDNVERTILGQAVTISATVDQTISSEVSVDGQRQVSLADRAGVEEIIDDFLASVFAGSAPIDALIIDPVGRVAWATDRSDIGQMLDIDAPRRSAIGGVPTGLLGSPRLDATESTPSGTRYVVPIASGGRTVAVLDVEFAQDPAVAAAQSAGRNIAWLFGGAFAALVIALVPLGWTSLGDAGRNLRKTRTLAMSDNLTGLANRTQFHIRLDEALAGAQRHNTRVGLLLLDLDGFKAINDTGGHAAGDRLLRRVAAGLGEIVRRNEVACRLGGDEFAVVVPRVTDRDELRGFADRLHAKLDLPVTFADGRTLRVTASIGVALFPDDATIGDDLVGVADAAMYQVKASRKAKLPHALQRQAVR